MATSNTNARIVLDGVDNSKPAFASISRSFGLLEASVGRLGVALPALSVGVATGAMIALANDAAAAVDEFNDLRDATGSSIENISALDRVARETGGSFETASGVLIKFNKVLSEADDDSKGAGAILKQLGLDAEELKRIDPAEALRKTAVALAGYADDGNKARAVQELFGKSIKEAGPFLKDLAEKSELVATTTTQAAEEAEKFRKELFRLQADATDLARAMTGPVVGGLNALIEHFRLAKKEGDGFLVTLLKQTEIARLLNLNGVSNGYADTRKELELINSALAKGGQTAEQQNLALQRRDELLKRQATYLSSNAGGGRGGGYGDLPKGSLQLDPEDKKSKGSKTDPLAEAKRYLETLQKQGEKLQELTAYEQALKDFQMKRLGEVTPALEQEILATAKLVDAKKAETEAKKVANDLFKENSDNFKRLADEAQKFTEATETGYEKLQRQLQELNETAANNPFISQEALARSGTKAWSEYLASLDDVRKKTEEVDQFTKQAAENIQSALGNNLNDILNGEFDNIGESFRKMLNRMVSEAIAADLSRALLGDLVQGGKGNGVFGQTVKTLGATSIGSLVKYSGTSFNPSAANYENSFDLMNSGASVGGGFLDSIGSWFSSILPGFAVGTDFVPRDMMAMVHKGERITPAHQNTGRADGERATYVFNGGVTRNEVMSAMQMARAGAVDDVVEGRRRRRF